MHKFELVCSIYTLFVYGGICDSSACHVYIMWVELCDSCFSLEKHKVGQFMCQTFLKSNNNKHLETGIKNAL